MHRGPRYTIGILFTYSARHHRRRTNAEPHRKCVNERKHRLGEAHGRDCVGTEPGNEEDVGYSEHAFHGHLQHHWNSQQRYRSAYGSACVIVMLPRRASRMEGQNPGLKAGLPIADSD